MATPEDIAESLASFGELAADITASALRVLAYTALDDVRRAIVKRDYIAAREAANALLQTLVFFEGAEQ